MNPVSSVMVNIRVFNQATITIDIEAIAPGWRVRVRGCVAIVMHVHMHKLMWPVRQHPTPLGILDFAILDPDIP